MAATTHRTIRVSDEVWQPAADRAARQGRSMTEVIVAGLLHYVEQPGDPPAYKDMTLAELRAAWRAGDREGDLEEALRTKVPALYTAALCWQAALNLEINLSRPQPYDAMDELSVPTPIADRLREIYDAHLRAVIDEES